MATTPRVALLIETAREYGRGVLRGIVRYARQHGPWAFYVTPGDFRQVVPKIKEWGGTGIIARIETPEIGEALLATGLPIVALDLNQSQLAPDSPFGRCSELSSDSCRAAELAAEHLLDRGFRHYAFAGIVGRIWSELRERAFCERIRSAGFEPHVYRAPSRKQERRWPQEQPMMEQWLRELPKPVGLMACNDDRGREVLEACRGAGVRVPEELAVVGVDDDELLCELADPPLSSVALNAQRGGFEAAALLAGMMSRRVKKPRRIVTPVLYVVTRRSTDVTAIEDPEVARSLQYIQANAVGKIRIEDLASEMAISRRALEIRFEKALGRTLHDEIRRVRLQQAMRLLLESDLPLPRVAEASGFTTGSYLAQVFKDQIGMSPTQYRRSARGEVCHPEDAPSAQ